MKILFAILACIITMNAYAQKTEAFLAENQLQAKKHISFPVADKKIDVPPSSTMTEVLSKLLQDYEDDRQTTVKKMSFETSVVYVQYVNGFLFHIADYQDGTLVVTCLEGDLAGYQAIGLDGVQVAESTDIEWNNEYFMHRYSNGKICTYALKQVAEFE